MSEFETFSFDSKLFGNFLHTPELDAELKQLWYHWLCRQLIIWRVDKNSSQYFTPVLWCMHIRCCSINGNSSSTKNKIFSRYEFQIAWTWNFHFWLLQCSFLSFTFHTSIDIDYNRLYNNRVLCQFIKTQTW